MLEPIPGTAYLQAVVPTVRREDMPAPHMKRPSRQLRVIVQIALEVACRIRPLTHLDPRRYAPAVRTHLSAHIRSGAIAGPVGLISLHVQARVGDEGDEVFGAATCRERVFAFAGSVHQAHPARLISLRIGAVYD